jgi:hypothetical protein
MTFPDFWQSLQDKTPGLRREQAMMRLTVAEFKRAVERAFSTGEEHGRQSRSVFEQMFGGFFTK